MRRYSIISLSDNFLHFLTIKYNKPDSEIRFPIFWLLHNDIRFLLHIYAKKIIALKIFEIHVFKIAGNSEFILLQIESF